MKRGRGRFGESWLLGDPGIRSKREHQVLIRPTCKWVQPRRHTGKPKDNTHTGDQCTVGVLALLLYTPWSLNHWESEVRSVFVNDTIIGQCLPPGASVGSDVRTWGWCTRKGHLPGPTLPCRPYQHAGEENKTNRQWWALDLRTHLDSALGC